MFFVDLTLIILNQRLATAQAIPYKANFYEASIINNCKFVSKYDLGYRMICSICLKTLPQHIVFTLCTRLRNSSTMQIPLIEFFMSL